MLSETICYIGHAVRGITPAGGTATHRDEPLTQREQEILAAVAAALGRGLLSPS